MPVLYQAKSFFYYEVRGFLPQRRSSSPRVAGGICHEDGRHAGEDGRRGGEDGRHAGKEVNFF